MTAVATAVRRRLPRRARRDPDVPVPPLGPRLQLARAVTVLLAVVTISLLLELLFASSLQERAAQQRLFDAFRADLAMGTAPIQQVDDGRLLAPGTAMAYLEVPSLGLRQVVVEGTASGTTFEGPGHRRDTPFPGQEGTSVIMGRRASFGAPFGRLDDLDPGDSIRVTTGQGEFDYEVLGVRREGDPVPGFEDGEARLTLVTADGLPFFPDGVLRVDARLVGEPVAGAEPVFTSRTLPASESFMGSDTSTIWALALWLQALIAMALGFVWAWHRWGRAKAWIVFVPPLLVVGLFVSEQAARLLPNML